MRKKLFNITENDSDININLAKKNTKDVAIIGIGLKFSGCNNTLDYWNLIKNGVDTINDFPKNRIEDVEQLLPYLDYNLGKAVSFKKGSFLKNINFFDHGKYKVGKTEATLMSPVHRLFLQTASQAIEDSNIKLEDFTGSNTGVYLGYSEYGYNYLDLLGGTKPEYKRLAVPGNLNAIIPARISYLLDLKGPALLIDTACSSSLVSIYQAYEAIINNTCDMALAGGARMMLYPQEEFGENRMGIESDDGKTRTFDIASTGTGIGEGFGCVLMKPLDKAIEDNNPIYAVIKGGAVNQDGKSIGLTAPNGKAQVQVLQNAWKNAGISPEQISYIEAHGTGTKIGDPIEVKSITDAFSKFTNKKQFCAISSVKTNLGHLDSAAGIAGFIKACLALKHKTLPKQIHFDFPNEKIDFIRSPLYVNNVTKKWEASAKRYCGVSSFGISGTNCHMILGEATVKEQLIMKADYFIIPLSSYSREGLQDNVTLIRSFLDSNENPDLYSLGYYFSLKQFRKKRVVFIAENRASFLELFQAYNDRSINNNKNDNIIISNQIREDKINKKELDTLQKFIAGENTAINQFYAAEKIKPMHIPVFREKPVVCWPGENELTPAKKMKIKDIENKILESKMVNTSQNSNIATKAITNKISNFIKKIFDVETIDVNQPLFELGFDSISIIQVQQHIRSDYGVEVSLDQLYQDLNTVEALAGFIVSLNDVNSEPINTNDATLDDQRQVTVKADNFIPDKKTQTSLSSHPFQDIFDKQLAIVNEQLKIISGYNGGQTALNHNNDVVRKPKRKAVNPNHYKAFKEITDKKETFTEVQQKYINNFIKTFIEKTAKSRAFVAESRYSWANHRNVSVYNQNWKELIYPIFAEKAEGAYMWDIDGNEYIDFAMGFGVYLLGYNYALSAKKLQTCGQSHNYLGPISTDAYRVAELIKDLTKVDRVAFYNSGTEAVMVALRIARGATKRKKIVVFAGSYHGTFDGVNVDQAGDYSAVPLSLGTLPGMVEDVLVLNYGTQEAIDIIKENKDELAAVLVEPVQSRRVDFQPKSYLEELRLITENAGITLIFDEVITGFRIAPGGAQEYFGIQADIVTYGKIVGGGLPIGVVAGKEKFINFIDGGSWNFGDNSYPGSRVLVAGTFCHHPLTMSVAEGMLRYLKEKGGALQRELNRKTNTVTEELNKFFIENEIPIIANNFGSMFSVKPKRNLALIGLLRYHLLLNNIYVWEGATCFISEAHTKEDLVNFVNAVKFSIYQMMDSGFLEENTILKLNENKARNLEDSYPVPLLIDQKRIFARIEMMPESNIMFNETTVVEVKEVLNQKLLQDALNLVVSRNEALRIISIGENEQQIAQHIVIPIDFNSVDEREYNRDKISKWLEKNACITFDLNKGPLLRCHVMSNGTNSFTVQLVAHHIAVDGWSFNVILKEINEIYRAYSLNHNVNLKPAKSFGDYIKWVSDEGNNVGLSTNLDFWKEELDQVVPRFEVKLFDFNKGNETTVDSGVAYFSVKKELLLKMKNWNTLNRVSMFSTLLGAYQFMLCSIGGYKKIRVGVPYAGQLNPGFENLVGQCVQMIPFMTSFEEDTTIINFIKGIMTKNMRILKHLIIPVEALLKESRQIRSNCSFDDEVIFNLDKSGQSTQPSDEEKDMITLNKSTKYDLFFDALEREHEIIFRVEYNVKKYTRQHMEEWFEMYKNLLERFSISDKFVRLSNVWDYSEEQPA